MADRAPRILLVDDEQPIQTLLSFPLQRDGYEVVQAADGYRDTGQKHNQSRNGIER